MNTSKKLASCRFVLVGIAVVLLARLSTASDPIVTSQNPPGHNVQRTMSLLASATKGHRTPVRILLYGQSIVRQDYIGKRLRTELSRRYPYADVTIENRAIGGYQAPKLRLTAEHDLYPFYPDLVVFHVYGGEGGELEEILRNIRERTTAEVITWSHHVDAGDAARTAGIEAGAKLRHKLALKYDLEWVDLRKHWKHYLRDHDLQPSDLLVDQVHLNSKGGDLMAKLVVDHFVETSKAPESFAPYVVHFNAESTTDNNSPISFSKSKWRCDENALIGEEPEDSLSVKFFGNRILAIPHPGEEFVGSASVLIDGEPTSAHSECYAATLPSPTPIDYRPALKRVQLGEHPVEELWTLKAFIDSEDGKKFHFTVQGSVTGNDGEGSHASFFVSDSGRIRIDPADFSFAEAIQIKGKPLPKQFDITWRVNLQGTDTWHSAPHNENGLVRPIVLAQGLTNEEHVLTLVPRGDGPTAIGGLEVHRPPLPTIRVNTR